MLIRDKLSEGSYGDVINDFKKDLTVKWPGNKRLSPSIVVQFIFCQEVRL